MCNRDSRMLFADQHFDTDSGLLYDARVVVSHDCGRKVVDVDPWRPYLDPGPFNSPYPA